MNLRIPITPPSNYLSSWGDEIHVKGVWVEDLKPNEDLTVDHIGEQIENVRIICYKENLVCEHDMFTVDLSSINHFSDFPFERELSKIISWDENLVVSTTGGGCGKRYVFDLASERVTMSPGTGCADLSKPHTLWDGIEFRSRLSKDESGRFLKIIRSVFD